MQIPLVTVLLPVYNCENYVFKAVESILNQTYSHFELLIIDDCSTDSTVAKIQLFKDDRIRLIVKPQNTGYTNSLNYGITIAKGKYIARMDGDDISLPTRFEKQVAFLEKNPDVVVCGTAFKIIDTDIVVTGPSDNEDVKIALLKDSCIGHPTAMIRKSILDLNTVCYNKSMEPAEDYDLWIRLLAYGKLSNLKEVLFNYRNHEGQVSITRIEKQRASASESRFNMLKKLDFNYTDEQKKVYIKSFSFTEKFTFNDILIFIDFKERLINYNTTKDFFKSKDFLDFLNQIEKKIFRQYFIGRKQFLPINIIEYVKLKSICNRYLKTSDVVKLFFKSVISFKVK